MSRVLLDTGVWFGFFNQDDQFHHDARTLVRKLFDDNQKIFLPEVERFELLNSLTHELLNHQRVREIDSELRRMAPRVEVRYNEARFWDDILPSNLPRLFLKTMDFIIASCALHWNVDEFYSFDEKLNIAMRRIKPEIVKVKIKKGRAILEPSTRL